MYMLHIMFIKHNIYKFYIMHNIYIVYDTYTRCNIIYIFIFVATVVL